MSLDQIATILRDSPMDTETKLFVIDLIALSNDERFVQDVMELILQWKKSDVEATRVLHDALFALAQTYQTQVAGLDAAYVRPGREIADRIHSEEKIEQIRQQIKVPV